MELWSSSRSCLPPHRLFVIDTRDRALSRGDLVGFYSDVRLLPWFAPGEIWVKRVAGVPGDWVDAGGVRVNGERVVAGLGLSTFLGRDPGSFHQAGEVARGTLFVVGTSRDAFDSRYWGPVEASQVLGRAYAVF